MIGRGFGALTLDDLSNIDFILDNPLRKDTIWMQGGSWLVLRIITDNPGVWACHCHIGWHLAKGKVRCNVTSPTDLFANCFVQMAVVVVQPKAIEDIQWSESWTNVRQNFFSTQSIS